jgi:hypothetical protein
VSSWIILCFIALNECHLVRDYVTYTTRTGFMTRWGRTQPESRRRYG